MRSKEKKGFKTKGNALRCIKVERVQNQKSVWKSKEDINGEPTKKHIARRSNPRSDHNQKHRGREGGEAEQLDN